MMRFYSTTMILLGLAMAAAPMRPLLATVYYVDAAAGSDNADGRQIYGAWRTLARAGQVNLHPGDYVLLKKGGVWSERLLISTSGSQGAPITFGAYGTGARPVLDGSQMTLSASLVVASGVSDIVIAGLAVRNAVRNGVSFTNCSRLLFSGLEISGSQRHGIILFDSEQAVIEDSDIRENAQDTSVSYDGIRIDGTGVRPLESFTIRNCRISRHTGGAGWDSANGVFLGHTGGNTTVIRKVLIQGNDVEENGNPSQNQAGRGITGTFDGDITLIGNRIRRNASAGVYLGDRGSKVDISITNNFFYNNALRQFGGFTESAGAGDGNMILVDDPTITAMGVEIGGGGAWKLTSNVFVYTTGSADVYRGFIRIFSPTQDERLVSDHNIFFSEGPRRWLRSDGAPLNFRQWQAAGHDTNSRVLESAREALLEQAKGRGQGRAYADKQR